MHRIAIFHLGAMDPGPKMEGRFHSLKNHWWLRPLSTPKCHHPSGFASKRIAAVGWSAAVGILISIIKQHKTHQSDWTLQVLPHDIRIYQVSHSAEISQHRPPCPLKISFIWPGSIPDLKMSATLATNKFCPQCVSLIIRINTILWLLDAIHHWQQHTQIHQQCRHPLYKLSLLSFQTVHGPFPSLLWWCWKAPNPGKTWQLKPVCDAIVYLLNPSRPYGNASEWCTKNHPSNMMNHHIINPSIQFVWGQKMWDPNI